MHQTRAQVIHVTYSLLELLISIVFSLHRSRYVIEDLYWPRQVPDHEGAPSAARQIDDRYVCVYTCPLRGWRFGAVPRCPPTITSAAPGRRPGSLHCLLDLRNGLGQ